MTDSLRALLAQSIDYAGLFPPAKLPLEQSAENYVRYRQSSRAWMVGGFVCTSAHLPALAKQSALSKLQEFTLSLVATPAESLDAAGGSLRSDLEAAREFIEEVAATCGVQVRVALEWRLPPDASEAEQGIARAFDIFPAEVQLPLDAVACEVPLTAAERHASAIANFAWRTNVKLGLKFRTGGLDAAAFPSAETLAAAFAACLQAGAAWKCTAGLHHPLPRHDATVNATMHGFINVLTASTLGMAHTLDAATLQAILLDDDPQHFSFAADELTWRSAGGEYSASLAQINTAREQAMSSFGSCSCEEPWEDLQALGWME